jgi:hypothetical protein
MATREASSRGASAQEEPYMARHHAGCDGVRRNLRATVGAGNRPKIVRWKKFRGAKMVKTLQVFEFTLKFPVCRCLRHGR